MKAPTNQIELVDYLYAMGGESLLDTGMKLMAAGTPWHQVLDDLAPEGTPFRHGRGAERAERAERQKANRQKRIEEQRAESEERRAESARPTSGLGGTGYRGGPLPGREGTVFPNSPLTYANRSPSFPNLQEGVTPPRELLDTVNGIPGTYLSRDRGGNWLVMDERKNRIARVTQVGNKYLIDGQTVDPIRYMSGAPTVTSGTRMGQAISAMATAAASIPEGGSVRQATKDALAGVVGTPGDEDYKRPAGAEQVLANAPMVSTQARLAQTRSSFLLSVSPTVPIGNGMGARAYGERWRGAIATGGIQPTTRVTETPDWFTGFPVTRDAGGAARSIAWDDKMTLKRWKLQSRDNNLVPLVPEARGPAPDELYSSSTDSRPLIDFGRFAQPWVSPIRSQGAAPEAGTPLLTAVNMRGEIGPAGMGYVDPGTTPRFGRPRRFNIPIRGNVTSMPGSEVLSSTAGDFTLFETEEGPVRASTKLGPAQLAYMKQVTESGTGREMMQGEYYEVLTPGENTEMKFLNKMLLGQVRGLGEQMGVPGLQLAAPRWKSRRQAAASVFGAMSEEELRGTLGDKVQWPAGQALEWGPEVDADVMLAFEKHVIANTHMLRDPRRVVSGSILHGLQKRAAGGEDIFVPGTSPAELGDDRWEVQTQSPYFVGKTLAMVQPTWPGRARLGAEELSHLQGMGGEWERLATRSVRQSARVRRPYQELTSLWMSQSPEYAGSVSYNPYVNREGVASQPINSEKIPWADIYSEFGGEKGIPREAMLASLAKHVGNSPIRLKAGRGTDQERILPSPQTMLSLASTDEYGAMEDQFAIDYSKLLGWEEQSGFTTGARPESMDGLLARDAEGWATLDRFNASWERTVKSPQTRRKMLSARLGTGAAEGVVSGSMGLKANELYVSSAAVGRMFGVKKPEEVAQIEQEIERRYKSYREAGGNVSNMRMPTTGKMERGAFKKALGLFRQATMPITASMIRRPISSPQGQLGNAMVLRAGAKVAQQFGLEGAYMGVSPIYQALQWGDFDADRAISVLTGRRTKGGEIFAGARPMSEQDVVHKLARAYSGRGGTRVDPNNYAAALDAVYSSDVKGAELGDWVSKLATGGTGEREIMEQVQGWTTAWRGKNVTPTGLTAMSLARAGSKQLMAMAYKDWGRLAGATIQNSPMRAQLSSALSDVFGTMYQDPLDLREMNLGGRRLMQSWGSWNPETSSMANSFEPENWSFDEEKQTVVPFNGKRDSMGPGRLVQYQWEQMWEMAYGKGPWGNPDPRQVAMLRAETPEEAEEIYGAMEGAGSAEAFGLWGAKRGLNSEGIWWQEQMSKDTVIDRITRESLFLRKKTKAMEAQFGPVFEKAASEVGARGGVGISDATRVIGRRGMPFDASMRAIAGLGRAGSGYFAQFAKELFGNSASSFGAPATAPTTGPTVTPDPASPGPVPGPTTPSWTPQTAVQQIISEMGGMKTLRGSVSAIRRFKKAVGGGRIPSSRLPRKMLNALINDPRFSGVDREALMGEWGKTMGTMGVGFTYTDVDPKTGKPAWHHLYGGKKASGKSPGGGGGSTPPPEEPPSDTVATPEEPEEGGAKPGGGAILGSNTISKADLQRLEEFQARMESGDDDLGMHVQSLLGLTPSQRSVLGRYKKDVAFVDRMRGLAEKTDDMSMLLAGTDDKRARTLSRRALKARVALGAIENSDMYRSVSGAVSRWEQTDTRRIDERAGYSDLERDVRKAMLTGDTEALDVGGRKDLGATIVGLREAMTPPGEPIGGALKLSSLPTSSLKKARGLASTLTQQLVDAFGGEFPTDLDPLSARGFIQEELETRRGLQGHHVTTMRGLLASGGAGDIGSALGLLKTARYKDLSSTQTELIGQLRERYKGFSTEDRAVAKRAAWKERYQVAFSRGDTSALRTAGAMGGQVETFNDILDTLGVSNLDDPGIGDALKGLGDAGLSGIIKKSRAIGRQYVSRTGEIVPDNLAYITQKSQDILKSRSDEVSGDVRTAITAGNIEGLYSTGHTKAARSLEALRESLGIDPTNPGTPRSIGTLSMGELKSARRAARELRTELKSSFGDDATAWPVDPTSIIEAIGGERERRTAAQGDIVTRMQAAATTGSATDIGTILGELKGVAYREVGSDHPELVHQMRERLTGLKTTAREEARVRKQDEKKAARDLVLQTKQAGWRGRFGLAMGGDVSALVNAGGGGPANAFQKVLDTLGVGSLSGAGAPTEDQLRAKIGEMSGAELESLASQGRSLSGQYVERTGAAAPAELSRVTTIAMETMKNRGQSRATIRADIDRDLESVGVITKKGGPGTIPMRDTDAVIDALRTAPATMKKVADNFAKLDTDEFRDSMSDLPKNMKKLATGVRKAADSVAKDPFAEAYLSRADIKQAGEELMARVASGRAGAKDFERYESLRSMGAAASSGGQGEFGPVEGWAGFGEAETARGARKATEAGRAFDDTLGVGKKGFMARLGGGKLGDWSEVLDKGLQEFSFGGAYFKMMGINRIFGQPVERWKQAAEGVEKSGLAYGVTAGLSSDVLGSTVSGRLAQMRGRLSDLEAGKGEVALASQAGLAGALSGWDTYRLGKNIGAASIPMGGVKTGLTVGLGGLMVSNMIKGAAPALAGNLASIAPVAGIVLGLGQMALSGLGYAIEENRPERKLERQMEDAARQMQKTGRLDYGTSSGIEDASRRAGITDSKTLGILQAQAALKTMNVPGMSIEQKMQAGTFANRIGYGPEVMSTYGSSIISGLKGFAVAGTLGNLEQYVAQTGRGMGYSSGVGLRSFYDSMISSGLTGENSLQAAANISPVFGQITSQTGRAIPQSTIVQYVQRAEAGENLGVLTQDALKNAGMTGMGQALGAGYGTPFAQNIERAMSLSSKDMIDLATQIAPQIQGAVRAMNPGMSVADVTSLVSQKAQVAARAVGGQYIPVQENRRLSLGIEGEATNEQVFSRVREWSNAQFESGAIGVGGLTREELTAMLDSIQAAGVFPTAQQIAARGKGDWGIESARAVEQSWQATHGGIHVTGPVGKGAANIENLMGVLFSATGSGNAWDIPVTTEKYVEPTSSQRSSVINYMAQAGILGVQQTYPQMSAGAIAAEAMFASGEWTPELIKPWEEPIKQAKATEGGGYTTRLPGQGATETLEKYLKRMGDSGWTVSQQQRAGAASRGELGIAQYYGLSARTQAGADLESRLFGTLADSEFGEKSTAAQYMAPIQKTGFLSQAVQQGVEKGFENAIKKGVDSQALSGAQAILQGSGLARAFGQGTMAPNVQQIRLAGIIANGDISRGQLDMLGQMGQYAQSSLGYSMSTGQMAGYQGAGAALLGARDALGAPGLVNGARSLFEVGTGVGIGGGVKGAVYQATALERRALAWDNMMQQQAFTMGTEQWATGTAPATSYTSYQPISQMSTAQRQALGITDEQAKKGGFYESQKTISGGTVQLGLIGQIQQQQRHMGQTMQLNALGNQLADMNYAQSMAGINMQAAGAVMGYRQSMESMGLQRQMWQANTSYQQQEMGIRGQQMQAQQAWSREDMAYGRQMAGRQYEWQTFDLNESIRFSTGRQKRALMRQKERGEETFSAEEGQRTKQETRANEQMKWEEERFSREQSHFSTIKELETAQFEMQMRHTTENFNFQMAQIGMQKKHLAESYEIQKKMREIEQTGQQLDMQYQLAELERQKEYYEKVVFPNQIRAQQLSDELEDRQAIFTQQQINDYSDGGRLWNAYNGLVNYVLRTINAATSQGSIPPGGQTDVSCDNCGWVGTVAQLVNGKCPVCGTNVALAQGGLASPTQSYLVGERGPELFVPNYPGVVVPNSQLSSGGMGQVSISISVGNTNATAGDIAREVEAAIDRVAKRQRNSGRSW
jgi:hypothetical protein